MGFSPRERAEAAELYRGLGLDVFPYDTRSVPFIGWNNPALWTPAYQYLVEQVHTIGVRCDEYLPVIDIDANRGGDLRMLESDFGPLPPTLTAVTPSGPDNLHLMFHSRVPLRTCKRLKDRYPGIDFLAAGSHIKGASSVRFLNTGEEVAYKLQHPVLDPAPLPAALERDWAALMARTEEQVWDELTTESLAATPAQKMKRGEADLIRKRIRLALEKIKEAPEGARHDPTFRGARDIYRAAVLLGHGMADYDADIEDAYQQSGGSDFAELSRRMRSVKLWVAQHPIPRPGVSAYHALKNREIGDWADAAIAAEGADNPTMQALVAAIAQESTTSMNMTTAGVVLAGRYPGCGKQPIVSKNLGILASDGWLISDGHGITELGFGVPHWKLEASRTAKLGYPKHQ